MRRFLVAAALGLGLLSAGSLTGVAAATPSRAIASGTMIDDAAPVSQISDRRGYRHGGYRHHHSGHHHGYRHHGFHRPHYAAPPRHYRYGYAPPRHHHNSWHQAPRQYGWR
jgi:hypothetical protein